MKTLLKITLFIAFVAVFASCQSSTDVKQILSNQDTKKAIMDTIANDSNLSIEMMEAMMNNKNSKMMMMEDHASMMDMMKDNPEMMQKMMGNMMKMCEKDSAMRSQIASMMTEHPEMMKMCIQKMKEKGMMAPDGKMKMIGKDGQSKETNHNH